MAIAGDLTIKVKIEVVEIVQNQKSWWQFWRKNVIEKPMTMSEFERMSKNEITNNN